MRAFLAFPIPNENREAIWTSCRPLRRPNLKVKWVEPQNLHVTLLFLGNIDEEKAALVAQSLKKSSLKRLPFEIEYTGIGQFPPKGAARVIITRIAAGSEDCAAYFERLKEELSNITPPADKRGFQAHITLGRVKGRDQSSRLYADQLPEAEMSGRFRVTRCVLFESFLTSSGPTYHEVAAVEFLPDSEG